MCSFGWSNSENNMGKNSFSLSAICEILSASVELGSLDPSALRTEVNASKSRIGQSCLESGVSVNKE